MYVNEETMCIPLCAEPPPFVDDVTDEYHADIDVATTDTPMGAPAEALIREPLEDVPDITHIVTQQVRCSTKEAKIEILKSPPSSTQTAICNKPLVDPNVNTLNECELLIKKNELCCEPIDVNVTIVNPIEIK